MEFNDVIQKRESIRDYNPDRPVVKEKLDRILMAGNIAPSAANHQPWRFYLISQAKNLEKIKRCYGREWFKKAPHVLVVAGKVSAAWTRSTDGYNSLETDLTIAMDHMILAAENEGVGTCWIAAFDPTELKKTGLFDDDETVFAITPLGYPNDGFQKRAAKLRKTMDEVVVYL